MWKPSKYAVSLMVLFGLVLALAAVYLGPFIYMRIFEYQGSPGALLPDATDWPEPVRELHTDLKKHGIDVDEFEVRLVWGSQPSTGSNCMCRMPFSSEALEFLKRRIGHSVEADFRESNYRSLPYDWAPQFGPGSESFICQSWADGDEGELWALARDPAQKWIFIEYYFNF